MSRGTTENIPPSSPRWHSQPGEAVAAGLDSPEQGLSRAEAETRLHRFGPNQLPGVAPTPWWRRLLRQFHNLLIYVLLGAAVLAALMQHWVDTGVILAVVLVNGVIGYIQEGRAEQALQAIRAMLSAKATVIRDGERRRIDASELVPGDRVWLAAGDKVPADVRLLQASRLQAQEAALTGESVPVSKDEAPVAEDADLGDRRGMLYSGTLITQGQGMGVVVATGVRTELGKINRLLATVEELTTPLIRQMAGFAKTLTLVILSLAVLVFVLGLLRGQDPQMLFMAVVSLAVAAIPEGLPTILTVALAIGVTRMARRRAIIRRLPAVETLGAVSVICSDKTGTLTRNEMMVASLTLPDARYRVEGSGYAPEGELHRLDGVELASSALAPLLQACVLCNDSRLLQGGQGWQVEGDPMEGALLTLALKGGLEPAEQQQRYPRSGEIPFDSRYKYMASRHRREDGTTFLVVKGAPDVLLTLCREEHGGQPLDQGRWQREMEEIAAGGQRVLGFAARALAADEAEGELRHEQLEQGLQLLGWVGLMDPPRDEAIAAVAECHHAGIQVKMITGDHGITAAAIAARLGLHNNDEALTGRELEQLSDAELCERVAEVNVFARTTPEHKLRLVRALQERGAVVAMTGDGVNDAPALKRADVGVAMGQGGTEAAKEASEMVLTDDNFATITRAVHEGRTVYDNLKKAIVFLLPVNGGESLSIILALLLALTLPIEPLQILWVNMVSSIGLAMALAFEASEPGVMRRPPRDPCAPILSRFLIWRILLVSILFTIGIFGVFQWSLAAGHEVGYARTLAVNTLVAMEVWYLFSVRHLYSESPAWTGWRSLRPALLAVSVVLALQLFFTYTPIMQFWFGTRPLSAGHVLLTIGIGLAVFLVLALEKRLIKMEAK
ncbi:cation-translocating P-type ATPase [Zobellella iuensis]|uniref:HAD-IC family P-type ATPase n=1 Tax=Zobellella iuensis TaxID=2803811 RepID=A0ABS1QNZ9_9GAMM|nr:HAD-IC family P-type ATPase [Zobellella iuensis]MBL1376587.1 HAD-IC family P-type ATPase [Zobellella iuensis]